MIRPTDQSLWASALPYLRVRSNDVHTLISVTLVQQLLKFYPDAHEDVVIHAMLLHDTGWSQVPPEKILQAFGPGAKHPEIQRLHELKGVEIAQELLQKQGATEDHIAQVVAIIDGHDTTQEARSQEDALVKDADKLWRYTYQAVPIIEAWFEVGRAEMLQILENYVLPGFLTPEGRSMAESLLAIEKAHYQQDQYV